MAAQFAGKWDLISAENAAEVLEKAGISILYFLYILLEKGLQAIAKFDYNRILLKHHLAKSCMQEM